ncbi:MAG: hypothetical protein LBG21_00750 [Campylobacteraceae bacterium]|jgi:Fic family protein|nr:hypothetical protein [Campylobacteraceae bacterium]
MEIENLESAIKFIEENTDEKTIFSRAYISNIHKIITNKLTQEGSMYPGDLRKHNVAIKRSQHIPPNHM